MDYKKTFEDLKALPEEEMRRRLTEFQPKQLLELLLAGVTDLHEKISAWPGLILDGMEKDLSTHEPSRREAEQLLERLKA